MSDFTYIKLALELAAQGAGLVSPNPLVGCVVVKDGQVIGRGYHRYNELKHAEAWALEEAGQRTRGATVYVNLEPCAHQGEGKRTPPCAKALIEAGVKRVVVSMVDPNPRVNGRGFEQLREAGIEVVTGLLAREARRLNEKYVKFVTTGVPFVLMKTACSLDGRIATRTGDSKWITGEAARAASQALRHEYDAILVGIGTVLADDPLLTDRTGKRRRRPLTRVVLDANLRMPLGSQLVKTAREFPLVIFTGQDMASTARREELEALGVRVIALASATGKLDLAQALKALAAAQLTSLIVEGGATVAGSFVEQRLVDKATFFIAPKIIGGLEAKPAIGGTGSEFLSDALKLEDAAIERQGEDLEITGYPKAM
ncbi:MAG TPA: bifunctional diaminohydroxyphosphoribosylaminopyrimidine deaminase/5-amino-6-(5-phosphoribosylamino)uracil reductase RibD [Blastocatellia bacterium]|jgi:diaminohydroxyphosphoribosylaminopyrimidine deaminase / 5-amino-6-(5-phosphoribosylamino)uracil reductase